MVISNNPKYTTRYFYRVVIVIGIPTIYIIYSLMVSSRIVLPLILLVLLYLIIARNIKKGVFLEDCIIVYFPFKIIDRQKKITYDNISIVKRGSSYYEGESLIVYMKSNKPKKIVLGYPSEHNKVGIVNILKSYDLKIDEIN